MSTYSSLVSRRDAYLAAELRILASQEFSVGQGGSARRNRRAELSEVRAAIEALETQIAAHPDNPANSRRRTTRTLRPLY